MPKDYLSSYSATASSNADIGGVNIDEGCAPSTINDAIREQMSHLAGFKAETETGAAVASATALLVNIPGVSHSVTGTTTITSLASPTNDTSHIKILTFAGALTFTHGSSLILPGAANITTVANDVAIMSYEGSDVWRCVSYIKSAGTYQVYDADNAVKDVAQEYTATQNFNATTLTSTTNAVAWDASANQVVSHTLTENTTFSAPTNLVDGAFYSLAIIQDSGASGYTVAFNAVFKFIGGTAPTWTTTASARDYISFRSNGANLYEVGHALDVS